MGRAFEYRKATKMKRWGNMARTFTRIGKQIAIAVKAGGPDAENNPHLRSVINNAKAANMPKDNVDRAIKRAISKDTEDYKEMVYEGYGPFGIAVLVETATRKADQGKKISEDMITGYKMLNENISQTIELIRSIEGSSKEQLLGIEQINDAISALDQQTQQNAIIASQTYEVAVQTDTIAKLVVSNANAKQFIGKDEVKAKVLENKSAPAKISAPTKTSTPVKKTTTNVHQDTKIVSSNSKDDDEWASF